MTVRWYVVLLVMAVAVAAGCALTDGQIQTIEESVKAATASVVAAGIHVAAPEIDQVAPGASGGIGAAIGAGVAALVVLILRAVRKSPPSGAAST